MQPSYWLIGWVVLFFVGPNDPNGTQVVGWLIGFVIDRGSPLLLVELLLFYFLSINNSLLFGVVVYFLEI